MSARGPRTIVGIDASNERSGWAVWYCPAPPARWRLASSGAASIWSGETAQESLEWFLDEIRGPLACALEVPQNGTHASRGGVTFAGGVMVAPLIAAGLERKNLRKVQPRQWRKRVFGTLRPRDWKAAAVGLCGLMGCPAESHDEAEAILIGLSEVLRRGYAPEEEVARVLRERGIL